MKTKEEIMIDHCAENGLIPMRLGKRILSAMDEYAQSVAIEFAEWLNSNRWVPNGINVWTIYINGMPTSVSTTSELYTMFDEERGRNGN